MNRQANRLRWAEQQRMDELKCELFKMNYFETPDGKRLYELNSTELEQVYENVKAINTPNC